MPRIYRPSLILAGLALVLLMTLGPIGCGKRIVPAPTTSGPVKRGGKAYEIGGKTYRPLSHARGFSQEGLASWYGGKFHGRRTANGEIYDMEGMTAAHKILPLNTWVKVTNQKNGREAIVRINDRGPFVDNRVIDLSKAAARKLGVIGPGTAPVKVVALGYKEPGTGTAAKPAVYKQPASYTTGMFGVQVGAFTNESNAWRLAATLRTRWPKVEVVKFDRGDQVFHRVRVGKLAQLEAAKKLQARLRQEGFKQAFAVAL